MAIIIPIACDSPHREADDPAAGPAGSDVIVSVVRGPYDQRVTEFVPPPLSPAQRDLVDLLGAPVDERPVFDAELRHELRAELEAGLADVAAGVDPDDAVWVSKHTLSSVHGCEGRHLAERDDPFAWTPPLARGTVVHKAIELSVHWRGELVPLDLVDEAVARLSHDDKPISDWLRTCTESDRAELRSVAGERVTSFLECFPPLPARWIPVTEGRLRAELLGGRVVLSGRTDLTLGRADGTRAGKVVIDLKTGGFSPSHTDDLRFYALIDTLRLGTPPRMLASYYLDSARAQPEVVTEGVLRAAVARTIDGVRTLHELDEGRPPVLRPGPACRWCPALPECGTGRAHLGDDTDDAWDDDLDDPGS